MSDRRPNLLIPIAAGAAALGIVAGMAAYFYFQVIPSREAKDLVASAQVIPDEAWIAGLLSADPEVRAQIEKFGNSQSNNVAIVPPLLRSIDSIAGIPIPREFLGTPKRRQISSQRRPIDSIAGIPTPRESLGTPKRRQISSQRRSIDSIAGIPTPRESLGTPKPRRISSQRRSIDSMSGMPIPRESLGTHKPRQIISQGRQKFTRSIQRQIEECKV
jgi:hypothetical protein